jgi:Asp/Glu/hydantoin racemase
MRILLLNPNTSASTTARMVEIAKAAAPPGVTVEGLTAPFGAPLITDPDALAIAAGAVGAALEALSAMPDGVIVAAFGDPGLEAARETLLCPVIGIAEASMAAARRSGRFGVATTTPDLAGAIAEKARGYGHGDRFTGVRLTPGDPATLMADPAALTAALAEACRQCVEADGAEAVIIGGGPLASAARQLRDLLAMPITEPVPEAVRLLCQRIALGR